MALMSRALFLFHLADGFFSFLFSFSSSFFFSCTFSSVSSSTYVHDRNEVAGWNGNECHFNKRHVCIMDLQGECLGEGFHQQVASAARESGRLLMSTSWHRDWRFPWATRRAGGIVSVHA